MKCSSGHYKHPQLFAPSERRKAEKRKRALCMACQKRARVMGMTNYRVEVFDCPEAGFKCFPNLKAAMAHRDWLRANNVADRNIRIVCTML